jgi:trehalose-phosphatase
VTKSFGPAAARLAARLRRGGAPLVILDFDGTLAPLVDHAARARLAGATRRELKRLRGRAAVAVISGRALADVRRRVRLPGLLYGGNHGVELAEEDGLFLHPVARRLRRHAGELLRKARRVLAGLPGVHVEGKGFGVSVHYRTMPAKARGSFETLLRVLKKETHALAFQWTRGHKVWDLRPPTGWNKGRALNRLWRRSGRPFVVCLGDDVTDEDMFRAVRGKGFGVKVGRGPTRAHYRLTSQKEVLSFLRWLSSALDREVSQ